MVLSRPSRSAAASVAALLFSTLLTPIANAMDVPSQGTLSSLRAASDSSDLIRVTTQRSRYELRRPAIDSLGVHHAVGLYRPALFVVGAIPSEDRRIPWADIERIDAGQMHLSRSLLVGMVVGTAIGGTLVLANGPDIAERGDGGVAFVGAGIAALCLLGGLLHGISSPSYEVLLTQNPSRR